MGADVAYYWEVSRYAVVYPGLIVVPLGILTVFRPGFGRVLLLGAALLGGSVFFVFGGDTRSEQVTSALHGTAHFQQDAPQHTEAAFTNSVMVFGIGLCGLAGIVLVSAVVGQ